MSEAVLALRSQGDIRRETIERAMAWRSHEVQRQQRALELAIWLRTQPN